MRRNWNVRFISKSERLDPDLSSSVEDTVQSTLGSMNKNIFLSYLVSSDSTGF